MYNYMRGVKSTITTFCLFVLMISVFCSSSEAFLYQEKLATSKSVAHYAMGQVYDLLGLTKWAILEYEAAAKFDDSSYLIHLRLGVDYARLNMLKEAEKELKKVNIFNPDELQSHYLLALIYSSQKDYSKATDEYELILKKFSSSEPQNIDIYAYLGQLYYSQKKYAQAIEQFETLLSLQPDNVDIMYILGSLYFETSDLSNAIETLKKAIKIDPGHDGSLNTLAFIYAEHDMHLDEALHLARQALEISPKNGAYLDSLGWVYFKKGLFEESLDSLREADKYLNDPIIYDHMGDVYYHLSQYDDAFKYWKLSLELLPDQDKLIKKIEDLKIKKQVSN
ncbi:MAG: tetratricopeptide repeat protein [Candidatus Omnitrophica bacterium]|nr:tetratricopeptide repeat protein [Candidatus Omnitrophota bacterium]